MSAEFQARSTDEGAQAQKIAAQVLTGVGFNLTATNTKLSDCGVTVNILATDNEGDEWLFDVSGAFTSKNAGLIRTDTMWKTLGRANVLHQLGRSDRLVFLTTNLPPAGSVGDRALQIASPTFFDAVDMISKEGKQRLRRYAEGGVQLPLPGFRAAKDIFSAVSLPATYGASLAVPLDKIGPIPGVRASIVGMPHRIEVFLPSLDKDEQLIAPATRAAAVLKVKAALSDAAGGCTTQEGKGSWLHPVTGIMDEQVSIVASYSNAPIDPEVVGGMITTILEDMEQHTAAVVMNGVMYHFTADD